MAKSTIKFTFNDENVANSYGFYVITDGIGLSRFNDNPVMLSAHRNSNDAVLGRWFDWQKEGAYLTAFPEFDSEDPDAAKIEGKVDRGFIRGVSMGLLFSAEDMIYVNGKIVLKKCELVEASIIPVPSNANALRLYLEGKEDTPLTEKEVKELCLSLQEADVQNVIPKNDMSKINLAMRCLIALGLKDAPAEGMEKTEIETHIMNLSARVETAEAEVTKLKTEKETLEAKLSTQAQTEIAGVIDQAITDGKIGADKKEAFLKLAASDPETVKATLAAIPTKASLGAQTQKGGSATANTEEVKNKDDFYKLSETAQLAFKTENPEAYAKLWAK